MKREELKKKVLFLDWNGTLSNSFFWEHMRDSKDEKMSNLYIKLDSALFSKPKEYIEDWMRGKYSTEEVLKGISIETGMEYDYLLNEFIKGCKSMSFASGKLPLVIKKLREKGLSVVIATNNMDCFTRWTVPSLRLNILFDDILNSSNLKGLKYEVDVNGESIFFKEFFLRNRVLASECIFLDDSVDRNRYISSLGIKYIQIKDTDYLVSFLEDLALIERL